jgi:magnesium transporter
MSTRAAAAGGRRAETARAHLVEDVPIGRPSDTVAGAIAGLTRTRLAAADTLYVVDDRGRLVGAIELCDLLGAAPSARLQDVMTPGAPGVHPNTDQEHVASRALKHGVVSVPVVDGGGRLLGVVPPLALLEVLRHEHVEDLHRLAGIRRETRHARAALEAPPARRARHRLPWLLAGLLGSTLSAVLMSRFEAVLEAKIAVAFFIPGIVYLADAIGTQTEAIAVRGLSLTEQPLRRMIWGEIKTGTLIGVILAVFAFAGVLLALRDIRLALAVAGAILAAGTTAAAVGIGFPALLARLKKDPAFGSGPLATIVQDVLSLVIYLAFVSFLL